MGKSDARLMHLWNTMLNSDLPWIRLCKVRPALLVLLLRFLGYVVIFGFNGSGARLVVPLSGDMVHPCTKVLAFSFSLEILLFNPSSLSATVTPTTEPSIAVTRGRLSVPSEHHVHAAAIVRTLHTTDRTTVPISTISDCFRDIKIPGIQSNSVTDTGAGHAVDCQLPLMVVNHCLNPTKCVIRPEIITFPNTNKENRRPSHLNAEHSHGHAKFA
ncbi:hypothetical protein Tco_0926513 [Tanacetum coccineum]|uniref:Uncharacterized protein n=1 Tax=Tanacetum coccineum TaxID=301880 RepID=A0ABQ5DAW9_9ASTR